MNSDLTVIGISQCDKMKKTFAWLDSKGIAYDFRDLKKDPLDSEELRGLIDLLGLDALVNRRGTTWRKSGLAERNPSPGEITDAMLAHQSMIIRPLLVRGTSVLAGYDEQAFEAFLE
jgi:arsenate reductase